MGMSHILLRLFECYAGHCPGSRHEDDVRTGLNELRDVRFCNDITAGFTRNACTVHLAGDDQTLLSKYLPGLLYRPEDFRIRHTRFRVASQADEIESEFLRFFERCFRRLSARFKYIEFLQLLRIKV